MKAKFKHGGARQGAGRKPSEDPKERIFIYVQQSAVAKAGGTKKAKELAERFLHGSQKIVEKSFANSK